MNFNPDAKNGKQGRVNVTSFRCPKKKCGGAMFDMTSRLAAAFNVRTYQCDRCKTSYAKRAS